MDVPPWISAIAALLTVAFGLWAGVVAWIGAGIRSDLKGIAEDIKKESEKLNGYIAQTEARLAVLEQQVDRCCVDERHSR